MVKDNKKKKGVTLSLGEFQEKFGAASSSWADDEPEAAPFGGSGGYDRGYDRGYNTRSYDRQPERPSSGDGYRSYEARGDIPIPDRPPFKAMIRNMDYKTEQQDVEDALRDCDILKFVHLTERDTGRPRGFGYIEFGDRESLVKAIAYTGQSILGREVRLEVAEQRDSDRRGGFNRGGDAADGGVVDNTNWRDLARDREATHPPSYGSRDRFGGGDRGGDRYGSDRGGDRYGGDRGGDRYGSARGGDSGGDWGRRAPPAERDSSYARRDDAPASRPRLNIQPRSLPLPQQQTPPPVKEEEKKPAEEKAPAPRPHAPHADPFGAARPVDTLARELEMEKRIAEKRAQAHAAVEKEMAERREHRPDHGASHGGRYGDRERDHGAPHGGRYGDRERGERGGERGGYSRGGYDRQRSGDYERPRSGGYDRQRSEGASRYDDRREHDDRSPRRNDEDRYAPRDSSRDRTDRGRDYAAPRDQDKDRETETAAVVNKFAALGVDDE